MLHLFRITGNVYRLTGSTQKLYSDLSETLNKRETSCLDYLMREKKSLWRLVHKKPSWRVHLAWLSYRCILI